MPNLLLTLLSLGAVVFFVVYFFRKRNEVSDLDKSQYNLSTAGRLISESISLDLKRPEYIDSSDENAVREEELRAELAHSIEMCAQGDNSSKLFVKEHIKSRFLKLFDIDENSVNYFIRFNNYKSLSSRDKFDIIIYYYMSIEKYSTEAFNKFIDNNKLHIKRNVVDSFDEDEAFKLLEANGANYFPTKEEIQKARKLSEDSKVHSDFGYIIYKEDVDRIFAELFPNRLELSVVEFTDIIVQRIYSDTFGLGVIDDLVDMNVNGVRLGTGGIPESAANIMGGFQGLKGMFKRPKRDYETIRIFFRGTQLHMDFLGFESYEEFERVIKLSYESSSTGPISKSVPYKVTERDDHSRLVTTAPSASDSLTWFLRKFDPSLTDIVHWFNKKHKNWEFAYTLIYFLAKGGVTVLMSGEQGSGKTTLLRGAVKHFPFEWNIRTVEGSFFELWLRLTYHWKEIVGFKNSIEGDKPSGIQYYIRRVDGTITINAEIVDEDGIVDLVQYDGMASKSTWGSFHSSTVEVMMEETSSAILRRNLVSTKEEAIYKMAKVLNVNPHLVNRDGNRFVSRISQVWPVKAEEVPNRDTSTVEKSLATIAQVLHYDTKRKYDKSFYGTNSMCDFDEETQGYKVGERPCDRLLTRMKVNMNKDDWELFAGFCQRTWDIDIKSMELGDYS